MKAFAPLFLYFLAYVILFGSWFATVLLKTPGAEQIVTYIHDTLVALTAHVLTLLQAPPPRQVQHPQAGRASPWLLIMLAFFAVWVMSGCAGLQQAVGGYETAAATGLRAAEDNNIQVLRFNVCATPFSAAVRHPDIIAAMRAWCLPNGTTGDPAALLNAVSPK